jgi:hypothetical protein
VQKLLSEIEQSLDSLKWVAATVGPGATGYIGSGEFRVVVVSFEVEGSRGYDGAATRVNTVIHLTRELAEKAFKIAESKVQ